MSEKLVQDQLAKEPIPYALETAATSLGVVIPPAIGACIITGGFKENLLIKLRAPLFTFFSWFKNL